MDLMQDRESHFVAAERGEKEFSIGFNGCACVPIGKAKIEHAFAAQSTRATAACGKTVEEPLKQCEMPRHQNGHGAGAMLFPGPSPANIGRGSRRVSLRNGRGLPSFRSAIFFGRFHLGGKS